MNINFAHLTDIFSPQSIAILTLIINLILTVYVRWFDIIFVTELIYSSTNVKVTTKSIIKIILLLLTTLLINYVKIFCIYFLVFLFIYYGNINLLVVEHIGCEHLICYSNPIGDERAFLSQSLNHLYIELRDSLHNGASLNRIIHLYHDLYHGMIASIDTSSPVHNRVGNFYESFSANMPASHICTNLGCTTLTTSTIYNFSDPNSFIVPHNFAANFQSR